MIVLKRVFAIALALIFSISFFSGVVINAKAYTREIPYYESVPDVMYAIADEPVNIYYKNIISRPDMTVVFSAPEDVEIEYYNNKVELTASFPGDYRLTWHVYDEKFAFYEAGEINFVVRNKNLKDMTVLVLGDSTVNAGTMTQAMLDLFEEDGSELTLLGTRGSGENLHEGRGGWRSYDYCESERRGKISNPFYNNGFDFAYYMNSQGYKSVDAVVIQLGINDIKHFSIDGYASEKTLAAFDSIISSIKNYNENIAIVISLTIPPNENEEVFENATNYASPEEYRTNIIRFVDELMKLVKDTENVYLSAANSAINTATEIKDVVHPTAQGYSVLAQAHTEALNFIANKEVDSGIDYITEAPSLIGVTNHTTGIKVSWKETGNANSYIVYRKIETSDWEKLCVTKKTSFIDGNVTNGKSYTYTVKAKTNAGLTAFDETGVSCLYIATPKLSVAANKNGYTEVKWKKVNGADGYYIYRKTSKNGKWKRIAKTTKAVYNDKNVKTNGNYFYTVRAFSGNTLSGYVSSGVATKYLDVPELLKITTAKKGVTLKYGAIKGAKSYNIYRKTSGSSWKKIATVSGKTNYLDKSAVKGTKYTYTVRAVNGKYLSYYNTKGISITDKY